MIQNRFRMTTDLLEGRYARYQSATCRECGYEGIFLDTTKKGAPPEMVKKKFQQKGWEMGQRSTDDECPKCVGKKREMSPAQKRAAFCRINSIKPRPDNATPKEKPMKAEQPRQPTQADKTRIRRELMDYYDEALGLYLDDFSDRKLGENLNVPFAWVANIRDAMGLGPDKNEAGGQFNEAIKLAKDEAKKLRADAEANLEAAAALEKRLSEIERGGYR